ncbi:MAG: ABC transporter ATP-binding protein [Pirellulaceae bacterium]|nr:MAG: ABC transporter ATP-binding protein [Pirellulaceae bacterium]
MSEALIQTRGLTKRYGPKTALDACTLSVSAGQIVGLLGPNGAGKTTLVRLLLGYLRPTAGQARIGGFDSVRQAVQVRRLVAYLPGEPRLFGHLRGKEVLRFFAALRGHSPHKAYRIAEQLELDLSVRVRAMSTGMRQKLALAGTFAADCPVLILDEPTSNLDPESRTTVLALVRQAQQNGATVLFSSHVLPEVEEISHRVVMLREGRVVADVSMESLRNEYHIELRLDRSDMELSVPREWVGKVRVRKIGDQSYHIDCGISLAAALRWLASYPVADVRVAPTALRTLYEKYFGSETHGAT